MIRKKERLCKAAKRYQTEDHWKKFKQYRAQVKAEIDKAHRKFIFDMLEVNGTTLNNTTTNQQDNDRIGKKYWKDAKSRKRETVEVATLKVNGETIENSKGKAEALNEQLNQYSRKKILTTSHK